MRVVLAEDLVLLRDGLVRLLESHGCEVVAAVGTEPELVQALRRPDFDLAIVDVRLPPRHSDEGLRAAIGARVERPGLPVVVLSQYVEPLYARELMSDSRGYIGYLLKDRVMRFTDFLDSVRRVLAGGTVMDPEVVAALLAAHQPRAVGRLTAREREVLALMAEGLSNASISARLHLSEGAVAKHINNIFAKLDLPQDGDGNRRVLAVLQYLDDPSTSAGR